MPSRKLRVLVVDDAVVVRKIVGDVLEEDPAIEVAATAPNGRIALQKLTQTSLGPWLLAIGAAGLIGFGLYSIVDARYRKV